MIAATLGSRRFSVRLVVLLGLLVATGFVLVLAGRLSGLPSGYGATQDAPAAELRERSKEEWEDLKRGTVKDRFVYIPIYLVWGLLLAALIRAARPPARERASRGWLRLARSPFTLAGAVVGLAAADMTETMLFRTSLTRLIDSNGAAAIDGLTRSTQVFTGVKFATGAAALALLAFQVLADPSRQSRRA